MTATADRSLRRARHFAALGHDLRQAAHAMGLHLEPLARLAEIAGSESDRRAVAAVEVSWQLLDGLLTQLVDLARLDLGSLRATLVDVEAAPLARDLVALHGAFARHGGVRLLARVGAERRVRADDLLLRRVLSNLLSNAIAFSPPGATVLLALRAARGGWRFEVRDAGTGIPAEAQGRVFEDFVRIDDRAGTPREGFGLGLAIARRLVALMGGRIGMRSSPGLGTCVSVTLPRAAERVRGARPPLLG